MNKNIANKIKLLRISKGISQDDLANHLNISQSAYAKIENGTSNLSTNRMLSIADFFQVEPKELLLSDNDKYVFNNSKISKSFIEHYYSGMKEAYESQIVSLKEEIDFLRALVNKNNKP